VRPAAMLTVISGIGVSLFFMPPCLNDGGPYYFASQRPTSMAVIARSRCDEAIQCSIAAFWIASLRSQ
ncbi:MAG: hypothetical protein NT113_13380, partial [Hyphomicrobiales bacterium]|nr:hypothetical protein [Hyphomicrobiales bacterium]